MWLLWAISITAIAAVLTVRLVRFRRKVTYQLEALLLVEQCGDGSGGGDLRGGEGSDGRALEGNDDDSGIELRIVAADGVGAATAKAAAQAAAVARDLRRCSDLNLRAVLISLCALFEGTFGWVTGSAWTNAVGYVWPSLSMFPTFWVTVTDAAAAASVTAVAVLWLVYVTPGQFQPAVS